MSTAPAYLIAVSDPGLQSYFQTYPFLTGPDEGKNRAGLERLRNGPEVRVSRAGDGWEKNVQADYAPPPEVVLRARALIETAGGCGRAPDDLLDDLCWKIAGSPITPGSILIIGCGYGDELIAARAIFPQAEITAIDWVKGVPDAVLAATKTEFHEANILDRTSDWGKFDIVFSNHTLEHFYDPDAIFARLRELVIPGGYLVSALPLDGDPGTAGRRLFDHWAANPATAHWFDAPLLDMGHPWKATAGDVVSVLAATGFTLMKTTRRDGRPSRSPSTLGSARRAVGRVARAVFLRPLAYLGDMLGGAIAPRLYRKVLVSLDFRLFGGSATMQSLGSPELLFVARL